MTTNTQPWWKGALIYQVYLRSFADSNGDGIGDIPGFIEKLDYIADLGVNAVWITPFYPSPMKDFGYDVSDYTAVDPAFGTTKDFERMVAEMKRRGLKVIMDHVWSHTSDEHPWFIASADPSHPEHEKYKDWFVWTDRVGPDAGPPNNWQSMFAGSAWDWHPKRKAWYLHNFLREQPDLNWHNKAVREAVYDIARFWLDRKVDGCRLDVCNFYTHDPELRDNPARPAGPFDAISVNPEISFAQTHNIHNINRPENLIYLEELGRVFAEYPGAMALGEMAAVEGGLPTVAGYVDAGRRLDAIYSGFLIYPSYPSADTVAELLTDCRKHLSGKEICWVTGTHDFHRVATRWQAKDETLQGAMVRQALALLLAMPGMASIYQGEELGLPDGEITYEQMKDPQGINFKDLSRSRDGCRTPFPWMAEGATLGFNGTAESWLPAQDVHRPLAADRQIADGESCLSFTKALVALRQETPAWRYGALGEIKRDGTVLAFRRDHEGQALWFLFNFSDKNADAGAVCRPAGAKMLAANGLGGSEISPALAPYGFAIFQDPPG